METTTQRYQRGSASAQTLQRELDAIVAEMSGEPDVPESVCVTEGSHGADPIATTIVITAVVNAGAVAKHAANKIFDEILLPKLRDRFADDALGPPVPDEEAQG